MRIGYVAIISGVSAIHHGRSELRGIAQQLDEDKKSKTVLTSVHANTEGMYDALNTSKVAYEIRNSPEDIPKIVQYELDKHGMLIRLSIVLSLIVLLIGGATATATCVFTCVEGMNRRKRIKSWESRRKGTPTQFTQSFGDPETDVETNIN